MLCSGLAALEQPWEGAGVSSSQDWSLNVPVSPQALCTAVAGPALLKTILQFFSSSEAALASDPAANEVAPGPDLWWGPESKRPRNLSGNEDPRAV